MKEEGGTKAGGLQGLRVQLLAFTLNRLEFAVPVEQVWRVEPLTGQKVTPVPWAPAFLAGVINVRGQVIPVLDLKKRFGLAAGELPPRPRILVVQAQGQRVGVMVDAVSDILWLPADRLEPPPTTLAQINGVFVRGVAKEGERLLLVLDLKQVLAPSQPQESKARSNDHSAAG